MLQVAEELAADDDELFHNDYKLAFFKQCFAEWSAKAAVVFTVGNGPPLLAAIDMSLPTLGCA